MSNSKRMPSTTARNEPRGVFIPKYGSVTQSRRVAHRPFSRVKKPSIPRWLTQ